MSHDTIPTGHTSPSLTATIAAGPDARRAVPESVGPAARGTEIGRYVVLGLLGRGAMGMVYAVYDPKLDRRIALKVLPPDRRIGADDHRARLLREAQALARLNHPNVVAVHDAGVVEEQIFVAMEHLEGQDLQRWQEVPRPWPEVLRTYVQAGRGLEAVHAAGLVHRDFKPANAVLADDGRVRVLDFGLARERVAQDDASSSSIGSTDGDIAPISEGSGVSRVTEAGVVLGTPAYMAPEQFRAQEPDARSDQFGFCVSLYEGLYGERPFEGRTPGMLMQHIVEGRVRDEPRGSKVPRWLREALVRGLAHVPDERWPSMTALLAVLTADRGARRRSLAVGALGVVTVAALGWGVSQSRASPEPTLPTACTEAAARLSGLWDDEQRVAVEEALTRTRTPFAVDVASAVTVRLDRYADDWVAMVTDSCRATHVRGEQSETLLDLRTACLERRRVELGAFVGVMSEADAAVVERAVSAAMKLTPIAVCGDADRLRATVPPPDDPAAAAEVEAIRMQLPAVRSSVNVGRYEEAISRLEQLDERAAAVDHGPVRAEVMALLGFVH
ncbi:MAG: serine/threonine protein kinase, partial [Deltaproteobacteria bacterium]|nr:serine/threonine protein kinase [Deltaproteobacteria bacterium]